MTKVWKLTSAQTKTEAIISGVISPHAIKTVRGIHSRHLFLSVECPQMQAIALKIFSPLTEKWWTTNKTNGRS
jgi:hypothetical protein